MPIKTTKPPTQRLPKLPGPVGKPPVHPAPPTTPPSGTPGSPKPKRNSNFFSKFCDWLGLKPDKGPWKTIADTLDGCADQFRGFIDSVFHGSITVGYAIGRSLKKFAAIKALACMGNAVQRRAALMVFKFGNRLVGGGTFLGNLADFVRIFAKDPIGTPLFYGDSAWKLLEMVGTISIGAMIEKAFGSYIFTWCAEAGWSAFVPFIGVPLLAGALGALIVIGGVSLLYNYCEQHPNSFLMRVMNAVSSAVTSLLSWLGSGVTSFLSWLGGLFKPSSASSSGNASSGKHGKRVHIKKKRFWRPGRILPPPWGYSPPPPPPPPLPAGFPPPWWPPPPPPIPGGNSGPGGGSPPPGAAAVPVGGVLFQNCHAVLTGIEDLSGGYWDERTHSLVLVGKATENGPQRNFSLPPMDADHLVVALRAALVGDPLGVSIDPPAGYRYGKLGQQMPPDRSPLIVSYLGHSEGTLAGAVFFEADRIMKCLSVGLDNKTRKPFGTNVPGFRSTFDMHSNGDDSRNHSWHRFWFVVDRVEIKKSSIGSAFTFGDVKIAVKTELQMPGAPAGQTNDPADIQFAEHLTRHYDEFAKDFPVFARLKELAKISAIATFVVNQSVSLDVGSILENMPMEVDAPETTPSILRSVSTQNGNVLRTHMMSGGVNLGVSPKIQTESGGEVSRFQQVANASRPSTATEWRFSDGNKSLKANAFVIGSVSRFRPVETDHTFSVVPGSPTFALQRIYQGPDAMGDMFGPGWNIHLPLALTVFRASGKHPDVMNPKQQVQPDLGPSVLFLREGKTGTTQLYRKISDSKASTDSCWALVHSQTVRADGVSFNYDASKCIRMRNDRFIIDYDGYTYHFDALGQLVECTRGTALATRYFWKDDSLVAMEDGDGHRYSFNYDDKTGVIAGIQTSDGRMLKYIYGPDGLLCEVLMDSIRKAIYGYDLSGRLTEIGNSIGDVTNRAAYNAHEEPIANSLVDKLTLWGNTVERTFDQKRIVSARDNHGTSADFYYGPRGSLGGITIRDIGSLMWKVEYGTDRKLSKITDPLGRVTEFEAGRPKVGPGAIASTTFPTNEGCGIFLKGSLASPIITRLVLAGPSLRYSRGGTVKTLGLDNAATVTMEFS